MKKILPIILTVLLAAISGCSGGKRSERFQSESSITAASGTVSSRAEGSSEAEPGKLFVYVCGEVVNPGVYELVSGSRVKDAVDLAGGLSSEADMTGINQASKVKDQDKIVVPPKNSGDLSGEGGSSNGLLDINRATKEQLMTLPGIGESKANAIISYRERTGGFRSIEEIQKIEGIKSGVFNKIKDSISVG